MKSIFLVCALVFVSALSEPSINEKDLKITTYNKKKQHQKAPKKVYIRSFRALFEVYEEASASTSSSKKERADRTTFTSGTSTRMGVQISGVDVADFQSIIDEAYASYVKQLTDQGFEIITADDVQNIGYYEGWEKMAGGASSENQAKGFVMVTPKGFNYMVKGVAKSGKEKGTFIDRAPKVSKELGDVYVADANFIFPFVTLDANSSNWTNSTNVKAKIDYKMEAFMNAGQANENANTLSSIAKGFGSVGTADLISSEVRFVSGLDIGNNPFFDASVELKKSVSFEDVFKDKKIKETTNAVAETMSKNAYATIVLVSGDKTTVASHYAECDRDAYVSAASGSIAEMMTIGISNFASMTKGK